MELCANAHHPFEATLGDRDGWALNMTSARDAAIKIVNTMKEMHQVEFTIVAASEEDFTHLDLNRYQEFKHQLEKSGFQYLGDIEILEVTNSPETLLARTMVRLMLSPEGTTYAGYYQIKPRIGRLIRLLLTGVANLRFIAAPSFFISSLRTKHCYELESEFSDGAFITTSNAESAGLLESPECVDSEFLDYSTSLNNLIDLHDVRFRKKRSQNTAEPIKMFSKEDLLAMQERLKKIIDAHRITVQWITNNELTAMSDNNTKLSEAVFKEVQILLDESDSAV